MKRLVLKVLGSQRLSEIFVREREGQVEHKLEVAELRENLVHEEYHRQVTDVYDFKEGKCSKEIGGFGVVQAVRHRKMGTRYAMKTIPLSRVKTRESFDFVMKEVDLLKSLDHPNIVRLQEVYVTPSHVHVAMDLIEGGNLAVRYRFEGEERAAVIVRQIIRALRYLHDNHIAHLDLKLENILLEDNGVQGDGTPCVKLIDFGFSAIFHENEVSTDVLGSWNYVAPEVMKGQYHPASADMWSLGVVTYFLMSGTLPFNAESTDMIKQKVLEGTYHFPANVWGKTSKASKHFIRCLLQKRPELRPMAEAAQLHAWLRKAEKESQEHQNGAAFEEEVTRSLLEFREADGMTKLGLEVVAHTLDPGQIHQLAEEFDRADNTNNGEVSLEEFKRWLKVIGASKGMTETDIETLFNSVDFDHSGSIHFNEFLAATIQQRQLDEAHLRSAFDRLDRSHTGFINLSDVTLTTGSAATEAESALLVSYFDVDGDGQISFDEFVNGMRRMRGSSAQEKSGLLSQSSTNSSASQPNPEWTHAPVDPGACEESTRSTGEACSAIASCTDDAPVTDTAKSVHNQYQGVLNSDTCVGELGDVNTSVVERNRESGDGQSIDATGSTSKPLDKVAAETRTKGGEGVGVGGEIEGGSETKQVEAGLPLADYGEWHGAGKEGGGVHTSGCGCVVS